ATHRAMTPCARERTHRERLATVRTRAAAGSSSSAQDLEIAIGDLRERGDANRLAPPVELVAEPHEHCRKLFGIAEPDSAFADELGMTAATEKRGRKPAGEPLEQRVRAGIIEARNKVNIIRPQQAGAR